MASTHSKPPPGTATPDLNETVVKINSTVGKSYNKIDPVGLPQIHVNSGSAITRIRDAIQIYSVVTTVYRIACSQQRVAII